MAFKSNKVLLFALTFAILIQYIMACSNKGEECDSIDDCCCSIDSSNFCGCAAKQCFGCFHQDTLVNVLRDYEEINIPIKDVKVGDLVASYDERMKSNIYEPIIVKLTHEDYV